MAAISTPSSSRRTCRMQGPRSWRISTAPSPSTLLSSGGEMPLTFGIRPEHIQIAFDGVDGVPATVEFSEYLGSTCYIYCRLAEGQAVTLESRGDLNPRAETR